MSLFDDQRLAPDALAAAVQQGVATEDGYAAIQFALQQAGYSISPSFRYSTPQWAEKLHHLFPKGHVNVLDGPKSTKPVFGEIVKLEDWGPEESAIEIETYDAPNARFSLTKAKVVHDGLTGLTEIHGPRKGVILLPAHGFMV